MSKKTEEERRADELDAEVNRVLNDCPFDRMSEDTRLYLERTQQQANLLRYPWDD